MDKEKVKNIAFNFIEKLEKNNVEVNEWDRIKNFIDYQFLLEKNKSKLNCDKNALTKLIDGQIW